MIDIAIAMCFGFILGLAVGSTIIAMVVIPGIKAETAARNRRKRLV